MLWRSSCSAHVREIRNLISFIRHSIYFDSVCKFDKKIRQMMFLDSPMIKLTRKDGIVSLMHCQERIFPSNDMTHILWVIWYDNLKLNYYRILFLYNFIENSIKSWNVNYIPNALHTHLSNPDWFAFFIHPLEKVKNIYVENKLEWKKRTTNYPYLKSVYVLIKTGKEDVGVNQNVIMWIVSGTLKIFYCRW